MAQDASESRGRSTISKAAGWTAIRRFFGPMTHAAWMSSIVFDGARAFEGVTPDSGPALPVGSSTRPARWGSTPPLSAGEGDGDRTGGRCALRRAATALYIRPMLWAEDGFIVPHAHSTRFCLTLFEAAMPAPKGFSVCRSSFRRPTPESAPTLAKAACLYPNSYRALKEAHDARVTTTPWCWTPWAMSPSWRPPTSGWSRKGAAHTPVPNGSFLNGVTRQSASRRC